MPIDPRQIPRDAQTAEDHLHKAKLTAYNVGVATHQAEHEGHALMHPGLRSQVLIAEFNRGREDAKRRQWDAETSFDAIEAS